MKIKVFRNTWDTPSPPTGSIFHFVNVGEVCLFVETQSPGYIYRWVGGIPRWAEEISKLEFLVLFGQTPESIWKKGKHLYPGMNNRRDGNNRGNIPVPVKD